MYLGNCVRKSLHKSVACHACNIKLLSTMAWAGKVSFATATAARPPRETNVPKVLSKVDAIMALQMELIELAEKSISNRRFQLLWIFLQTCALVIIKAYHLVMYMIRVLLHHEPAFLDVPTALLYYGYQIITEGINIVLTIIAFSLLFQSVCFYE
ncbi:uncharacterized protein LOC127565380 [Drosophila albomicans]|uniref:Uncharacterized protein LOC127565380 n=1 Tax=Drosophila albomicans TaxID=7291 RepID=A0A9C6T117_DROAB|nr:uncharacterized protein LOC127565380 [Drosophila albomicans]